MGIIERRLADLPQKVGYVLLDTRARIIASSMNVPPGALARVPTIVGSATMMMKAMFRRNLCWVTIVDESGETFYYLIELGRVMLIFSVPRAIVSIFEDNVLPHLKKEINNWLEMLR